MSTAIKEKNIFLVKKQVCDYCKKLSYVDHYDSIFSKNGEHLCSKCAAYECCNGCYMVVSGGLCSGCRYDSI
jgi:hypothetical protein